MKIQISDNIFLEKVAIKQRIPFILTFPHDELKGRLKNMETNKNTQTYKTSDAFFDDLGL